ncbi:MAG: sugar kinase [Ignavibacteriae bacterium]|nr:sugar kinase [Ignavibacteriota bacterium]MCB9215327.1 sugar kinase [Ignavibacteria bacterium]
MSILVIGTLAYDSIETPFGKAENALGGSANYIALAASYLSQNIGVVSIIGDDYEESDLQLLHDRNIDTTGVEKREGGKTFRWSGRYHHDLNTRDTLDTQLNVLLEFDPKVPAQMNDVRFVCLGNLDPAIQLSVLDQVENPLFTICDTMNFWIESTPEKLREALGRVDCLIINDSEARELADDPSLIRAARKIRAMGPQTLIIKKGEHGALLFVEDEVFSAPAWPLEEVFDPTGAGDTFAGGFVGYLAKHGEVTPKTLRSAVVYGSALASFCVEEFSVKALLNLSQEQITERVQAFRNLSHFELDEEPVRNAIA